MIMIELQELVCWLIDNAFTLNGKYLAQKVLRAAFIDRVN